MDGSYILAIDQGTTSSRAILFDRHLAPTAVGQQEFTQHFPHSGWVEHEPEEIWSTTVAMCREAMDRGGAEPGDIAAIGITNQRETTVVWDRRTGRAVYNAIVWQDRRTAEYCKELRRDAGLSERIAQKTGLLLDPYFSATKLRWILENVEGAAADAAAGHLLFGTVDSYLIWRLTGGASHVTDATNAARTMLYNIVDGGWDAELLQLFGIPASMMPEVRDSAGVFGLTTPDLFGAAIAITGVAGDQQAATVGQACFTPGMAKSTYGTGCFMLMNTGTKPVFSKHRMLSTIAYQLDGQPTYALEGSIFVAGAVVQWLRDGVQMVEAAGDTQALAEAADPDEQVYFVPAFTGLGAPYWNAECRGAIFGLTRNTGRAEIARAALQSVAFQTRDLLDAMLADAEGLPREVLRVDGGMTASDWAMQALADQLGARVDRPVITETTARGAAYLAARGAGLAGGLQEFAASWKQDRAFEPTGDRDGPDQLYLGWQRAVARLLHDPGF